MSTASRFLYPQDSVQRHRWTVKAYHQLAGYIFDEDTRVELIEGTIYDRAPIGSLHAALVTHLVRLFDRAVGEAAVVSVQNPVVLGEHSEPEPDIMLLRPKADFYAAAHPRPADVLLIVEISDSSLRYDRETKVPLYARHGIPEVWLIDVESQRLSVYHTPGQQGYLYGYYPEQLGSITPQQLPEIELDLSKLFEHG